MKVNTVEQFKVLDFIKANFIMEEVSLELIDRYTIRLTDKTGESMNFKYNNGNIVY
ncbi:hypothetical protein [Clostridium beijerinckii]|uniref:Uncharacterized protein n=1 Tax=Clostridium beijerinckii TaxID=1520 RepID=A0AAW3WHI1_CLOBE|nr:hypothetical protein [Clostridium beijerinckii]MBC2460396.1 hypothetical protein [Clostridium beijerinckii]MBC2477873.1 hypothetical protein [Clostridium beijerinckii]NOV63570.1 hypothetical protein [Clostridium beijerinckii]NOV73431.1 hypothetical protein [Clostridium beijerinckii]NOW35454.1 hypothetical protein [Clostridium beijerinckii]